MATKHLSKNILWAISGLIAVILIGFYILTGGTSFFVIIGIASMFFCADKCYDWADRIHSNTTLAFFIGFFLSFIGLTVYYLINMKKISKSKPKRKKEKEGFFFGSVRE